MRDQIDGRLWAEHGHLFSVQLDELLKAALSAFQGAVAKAFASPRRNHI